MEAERLHTRFDYTHQIRCKIVGYLSFVFVSTYSCKRAASTSAAHPQCIARHRLFRFLCCRPGKSGISFHSSLPSSMIFDIRTCPKKIAWYVDIPFLIMGWRWPNGSPLSPLPLLRLGGELVGLGVGGRKEFVDGAGPVGGGWKKPLCHGTALLPPAWVCSAQANGKVFLFTISA